MNRSTDSYVDLLKAYNAHTNIYSKGAYERLAFHVQDSVNIASLIDTKATHILDIGSGSGLPSIPLAIEYPALKITAVESKSRKTNFLNLVKNRLNLDNLTVVTSDIVEFIHKNRPNADYITAKAFAPIERILPLMKLLTYTDSTLIIPISENQRIALQDIKYPPYIGNTKFTSDGPHCYAQIQIKKAK